MEQAEWSCSSTHFYLISRMEMIHLYDRPLCACGKSLWYPLYSALAGPQSQFESSEIPLP